MNRLAGESSPYLRQHAENPVDWYPWGEEAFARARSDGKPIILSVGYSACHWCHVMAHESFEDPTIAGLMNDWFVNIKVDREERPDVDAVYMTVTQALTRGQGGWPMTVFLTPDLKPFYAGTYFPAVDAHGRTAFPRLLELIHTAWEADREKVVDDAAKITTQLQEATHRANSGSGSGTAIDAALPTRVVEALRNEFDEEWGGFGHAPKFPSPSNLEFLLAYYASHPDDPLEPSGLDLVTHTLRRMMDGGIYDHLGGGFHRYSVDARWLVPHFEKMLYDNAQLARLYLHAFQITGDPAFERVVRETLAYLEREMLDRAGGFYAAQDADTEGIEGKFFVWSPAQIDTVLGAEDGHIFRTVYAVTDAGNFEDPHHPEFGRQNILHRPRPLDDSASELGIDVATLEARLLAMRDQLLAERETRVHPGLDDKVLASWNGLALAAFAECGRVLGDSHYVEIATGTATFLRRQMWDAGLLHTWKDGETKVDGLLEDYAYVGLGLLELFKTTGDIAHLHWAQRLLDDALDHFHDEEGGGFFESPLDGEELLLRQKPFFDAATPSGNGAMALFSTWLARYTGNEEWETIGIEVLALVAGQFQRAVTGFGSTLLALDLIAAPPREVAIVGAPELRAPFEREVARRFLPTTVIVPAASGGLLPVLEGRGVALGEATAYVCEAMACGQPARTPDMLREQLDAARR
ncbi:MAG: thioredoxin domain-containing protein [Dehalococcoidia bacterium]|nr:thioredoxin domain-containing protein [Dehalococcoidia bacterium]